MSIKSTYLITYNLVQTMGWMYALVVSLLMTINGSPSRYLYFGVTPVLRFCQLLSVLEVFHAATGLVRTGVVGAFTQWFARTHCLVAVVDSVPEVQGEVWVAIMYMAWSFTEVVRYPWYALSIAGSCPEWLTWLRYTIFIPTYPFGVVAEMLLLYHALPYARERDMYNLHMPNWYNFAFDWHNFMVGGLCYYPVAWLQLYTHMFAQRKKKLTTQFKTD